MNPDNNCLTSGQVKICLSDGGIIFTVKPLLAKAYSKIIPYADIKKIEVGPKWWIFPGFRILANQDAKIFIEPGMNTGFNFKHNQITFPFWQRKKWQAMAEKIRSKI